MRRVRFSGFPSRLKDESSLRRVFGTLGSVVKIDVTEERDTISGICRFADPAEAGLTLQALNGLKIGSNAISVVLDESGVDEPDVDVVPAERSKSSSSNMTATKIPKKAMDTNKAIGSKVVDKASAVKKVSTEEKTKSAAAQTEKVKDDKVKGSTNDTKKATETSRPVKKTRVVESEDESSDNEPKLKRNVSHETTPSTKLSKSETNLELARMTTGGSAKEKASKPLDAPKSGANKASEVREKPSSANGLVDVETAKSLANQEIKDILKSKDTTESKPLSKRAKMELEAAALNSNKKSALEKKEAELSTRKEVSKKEIMEREAKASAAAAKSGENNIRKDNVELSRQQSQNSVTDKTGSEVQANQQALHGPESPAPDEEVWEVYFDDNYGRDYFFNTATGETTWLEPPSGSKIVNVSGKEQAQDPQNPTPHDSDAGNSGKIDQPLEKAWSHPRDTETSPRPKAPPGNEASSRSPRNDSKIAPTEKASPISTPPVQQAKGSATGEVKTGTAEFGTEGKATDHAPYPRVERSVSQSSVHYHEPKPVSVREHRTTPVYSGEPQKPKPSLGGAAPAYRPAKGRTTGEIINLKPAFGFIKCHAPEYSANHMYFAKDAYNTQLRLGDEVEFSVGFNAERRQPYAYAMTRVRRESGADPYQGDLPVRRDKIPEMGDSVPAPYRKEPSVRSTSGFNTGAPGPTPGQYGPVNDRPAGGRPRSRSLSNPQARARSPRARPAFSGRRSPPRDARQDLGSGGASRYPPFERQSAPQQPYSGPRKEWTRHFDKSGRPYWYCAATDESTWEDPHRR